MNIEDEICKLISIAKENGADALPIDPKKIKTAEWVLLKCRFGCPGYGRRYTCPPYSPAPSQTRKILDEYSCGLLVRFVGDVKEPTPERVVSRELTRHVQTLMLNLESTAFHDGFYKAFSFTGHQCGWCQTCEAKKGAGFPENNCVNKKKARPSMESAGIDVYHACQLVGWNIKTLTRSSEDGRKVMDFPITTVMLLLIE